MPSTYTTNTGIEKPASGEQSGSWGVTVNTNMDIIDRNLNGSVSIALTGTTSTLTTNDGSLSNGHYKVLKFTGTLAATHTVTVDPADAQKIYMVHNATNQTVTFTQGTGVSNASVLAGEFGTVYADGSDECHNLTTLQSIPTAVQDELDTITADDWVTNARIATDAVNADSIAAGAVGASEIADNSVGALQLNVSGNGTSGQYLISDSDGSFSWNTLTINPLNVYDADATTATEIDLGESIRFDDGIGIDVQWTDTSAPSFELEFNLKTDRRHNANADVYTGNTSDYIFFDSSHGIRFYTAGGEDMFLTDAGVLHVDSDIVAYSSTIPSDQRLKENIQPISDALNTVSQLTGYTFNYKKDGRASAGVIAQELEKVLPSAVTERDAVFDDDGETYKTVQYDQLHAVLIEAIKELKAKVEALENGG